MTHHPNTSSWLLALAGAFVFAVIHFIIYRQEFRWNRRIIKGNKYLVPFYPYRFPVIGHILALSWKKSQLIMSLIEYADKVGHPINLSIMGYTVTILSHPSHINEIFKPRPSIHRHSQPFVPILTRNLFGSPRTSLSAHQIGTPQAHLPQYRIAPTLAKGIAEALNGKSLTRLSTKFQKELMFQIDSINFLPSGSRRTPPPQMQDLWLFVRRIVFTSSVNSVCGKLLLETVPDFENVFWNFDECFLDLFSGVPKWIIPNSWRRRDVALKAVTKWLERVDAYLNEMKEGNCNSDLVEDNVGQMFQAHRAFLRSHKEATKESLASDHLGLLWGIAVNSTSLAFWTIYHVVRDPILLERVRLEATRAILPPNPTGTDSSSDPGLRFDIPKLTCNSLLLSIYAEAARLHVNIFHIRGLRGDVELCPTPKQKEPNTEPSSEPAPHPWILPKETIVLFSTTFAHRNHLVWNTGSSSGDGQSYPIDQFWGERFLSDPNRPDSGPLRKGHSNGIERDISNGRNVATEDLRQIYAAANLSPHFIPYGGGGDLCPGRHFAKQEVIIALATFIIQLDISVEENQSEVSMIKQRMGTGVPCPDRLVVFSAKRRLRQE